MQYISLHSFLSYPDLVWAAVSSSAPLLAKVDFWEYYDTCYDALGTMANGAECQQVYTDAFLMAEEMLNVIYLFIINNLLHFYPEFFVLFRILRRGTTF